jgi:hypothetical protein
VKDDRPICRVKIPFIYSQGKTEPVATSLVAFQGERGPFSDAAYKLLNRGYQ